MNTIPVAKNEQGRVAALKLYDILDTAAEQEFDNLAQLAAEICNTPIALINLIDETRQWTKARVGLDINEISRDYSFCYYTILDDELFEITNPLADSRFDKNPLVTGSPGVRFYAGVPLVNKDGYRLGTLCVMSPKHHQLNSYQRISLQILGSAVMSLLELRRERQDATLFRTALDEVAGVTVLDAGHNIIYANDLFCKLTGLKETEVIGKNNNEIKLADMPPEQAGSILGSINDRKIWKGIVKNQNIKGAVSWSELTVIPVANKDNEIIKIVFIRNEITNEILLKERLEESESLAKTGRWELNIFNRHTLWTQGMFALLDVETRDEQLAGQSIMNFISPADFERVNEANKKLLEKKTNADHIEFRIVTKKGREKDISAIVKKRFNSKGGLTGIYGTLLDITDKKTTEHLVNEKDEIIYDLYNNAPCGYYSIATDGYLTDINATALKWLGYMREDVVGKFKEKDLLQPGSVPGFQKAFDEVKKTGFLSGLRGALRTRDGNTLDVLVNAVAVYDKTGKFNHAKYTLQDITVATELQQRIDEAQAKLRTQVHGTDQLMFMMSIAGNVTYCSDRLKTITGLTDDELMLSPFSFAWNDEWRNKAISFYRNQLQKNERETIFVMPVKDHTGEKLWMELTTVSIIEDEATAGLRCSLYDITERVNAEDKLREVALIALEVKDMQQTVLEKLNHDVRTPLDGVMGIISLLSSTHLSVEQKILIGGLKDTAGELLNSINNILEDAKVAPTKAVSVDTSFELKGLVNNIIYTLKPAADEKNIRFALQVDNKIPLSVIADKEALSKILMNLAGNSLKFTEKGSISIGVFYKSISEDIITLEFVVKDTGIGIPQNKLATVFGSFTEGDRNPRLAGNAGLGLAIAQQLVEQQNGEIKVRSQEGVGTTFSFTFHVRVSNENIAVEEQVKENTEVDTALEGYHILLVEDNTMNQRIGRTMLENWGAKVTVADWGKKAIELVTRYHFDLILMDIQMPEMSGIEATAIIRQDLMDNTPIMGMTVSEMQASRESCMRAGMNDYILKPLKPAELHRKVFALLNKPEVKLVEKAIDTSYVKEKITNITYLNNITDGDVALTKEILEIYITKTPTLMEELEMNMTNRNYKMAQAGAHYLKNSVGLLGADTLFHMLASLENQLNHIPPSPDTYDLLTKMKGIIEASIEEATEELNNLGE